MTDFDYQGFQSLDFKKIIKGFNPLILKALFRFNIKNNSLF